MATFAVNGAATLYYDNSAKLITTVNGIDVTGTGSFDTFVTIDGGTEYGRLEVGGDKGAYIDLKAPDSDDYDLRVASFSGHVGGFVNTHGADSSFKIKVNNADKLVVDRQATRDTGNTRTHTTTTNGPYAPPANISISS